MEEDAIQTYRYLRIGMVGAVVLLGTSILVERGEVDCWQTSISGYYYTPVRAILVGGLFAIGFALIVIKGRTTWIDVLLNFAGMLAPIVAVAPTTNVGECWSVSPPASPLEEDGTLASWVVANIDNNIWALILTGFIGIAAWLVISAVSGGVASVVRSHSSAGRWALVLTVVFIVVVWLAFRFWDDFYELAHGWAAVGLFVLLAAVVLLNARVVQQTNGSTVIMVIYYAIFGAMVVAAIPLLFDNWEHNVLIVEATEILLFAIFWTVQTYELWNTTSASAPSP